MKFKPKSGEKEIISFRIPKVLLSEVDLVANKNSLSRNEFMIQCLEYALDNIETEENSTTGKNGQET